MNDMGVGIEDDAVLTELRREARRRGHIAVTISSEDVSLYLMWFLGILLGLVLARKD